MGDFNIHVDIGNDPDSLKLSDLLDSLGLHQHVDQLTHIHGHTLDLVITRCSEQILKGSPCVNRFFSDHASVMCTLYSRKPGMTVKSISYRKLKSIDTQCLKSDISESTLCSDPSIQDHLTTGELDVLVQRYQDTLTSVNDRHAPIKTRIVVARPKVPWYNEEIDKAKHAGRKAERIWRRTISLSDLKKLVPSAVNILSDSEVLKLIKK